MMTEALCNHEPDGIRRKCQGAVLAECDVHSVDQWMAPAYGAEDVHLLGKSFPEKINGSVDHLLLLFWESEDLAEKASTQTVCQIFGPYGLFGWRNRIDGKA